MIEALKADLQTLSDALPVIGQHITQAVHSAEALQSAAQELQHEVDAASSAATADLQAVHDALPELAAQAGTGGKQIETAAAAASQAWSTAEQDIEGAGEKVANHADELVAQAHDLVAVIAEVGTRIDQSEAIGEAALARLTELGHDTEERLRAAMQALQAEIAQVQQVSAHAKAALDGAAHTLWSRLQAITTEAADGAQQALQGMHEHTATLEEGAQGLVAALDAEVMERVDASGGQLETVLTPLGQAHDLLRVELERVSADADEHERALSQHGQALDGAVARAESDAKSVPADVAAIQETAHQIGLHT